MLSKTCDARPACFVQHRWAVAALVFIHPVWAATNILLVGGLNLAILKIVDGTILLVSKLCFYCLLLSVLWLLEPLWAPKKASTQTTTCTAAGGAETEAGAPPATNSLAMQLLPPSIA